MRIFYLLPALGAVIGGLEFVSGFAAARSAPQQAASAAMAVAWAVLPYVFARAMVEMTERAPAPAIHPAPTPPLTVEEQQALKARRTRTFITVGLILVALLAIMSLARWQELRRPAGFYEQFPGAP